MITFFFPLQGLADLNLTVYPLDGGSAVAGPTNFVDSGDPPGTYELSFVDTLTGPLRCTLAIDATVIKEFIYTFSGSGTEYLNMPPVAEFMLFPTFAGTPDTPVPTQRLGFFTNDFSERRMIIYETTDAGELQELDLLALGEDLLLTFEQRDMIDLQVYRTADSTLTITGESPGTLSFIPTPGLVSVPTNNARGSLRIESTGKVLWRDDAVRITYVADQD